MKSKMISEIIFENLAKKNPIYIYGLGTLVVKSVIDKSGGSMKLVNKVTLVNENCGEDLFDLVKHSNLAEPCSKDDLNAWLEECRVFENSEKLNFEIGGVLTLEVEKRDNLANVVVAPQLNNYINGIGEAKTDKEVVPVVVPVVVPPVSVEQKNIDNIDNNSDKKEKDMEKDNKKDGANVEAKSCNKECKYRKPLLILLILAIVGVIGYFVMLPKEEVLPVIVEEEVAPVEVVEEVKEVVIVEEYLPMQPKKGKYYLVVGAFYEPGNYKKEMSALQDEGYKPYYVRSRLRDLVMLYVDNQDISSEEAKSLQDKFEGSWFYLYK